MSVKLQPKKLTLMGFLEKQLSFHAIFDKTALEMLVEETRSQLGQIDILVCNAASNPFFGSIKDIPDDAFEKIMNNNIKVITIYARWLFQK